MTDIARARRRVVLVGVEWRWRVVKNLQKSTPASRRALEAVADRLDDAISEMFDSVYEAEFGRNRKKESK